jgi:hypothetical protein
MNITGGKRKVNKSLKDWVTFVKKVQREEKLSYKDAIHRAKQRKDKGEKWMTGGKAINNDPEAINTDPEEMEIEGNTSSRQMDVDTESSPETVNTQLDTELDPHGYEDPVLQPIRNPSTDDDDEYYRNNDNIEMNSETGNELEQGGKRKRRRKTMKKSYKKRRSTRRRASRRH